MILMLSHLVVNLPVRPLFTINISYNKVRVPGIVTFFTGIANFFLAVLVPYLTGWGYYGVAVAGAITLTFKSALFTPWYATKILGVSKTTFISSLFPGVIAMIITAGASYLMMEILYISGFVSLLISGMFLTSIYLAVVWGFGLNQKERSIFETVISTKLLRKKEKINNDPDKSREVS